MKSFSYELELIPPVVSFFQRDGCIVHREVRIGFCRADIVAFTQDKKVVAVELKLSNWKKALVQAKNYQLASDYTYVAFPLSKSYLLMKKASFALQQNGIGLLVINEKTKNVCKIIDAKQSNKKLGTISIDEIRKRNDAKKGKKPWMF
jgi:hypothetical protein